MRELLIDVLFGLPIIAGVGVSLWAWRKTRNTGYLLIAVFFLAPFFGIVRHQLARQLHREEWEQKIAAAEAELQAKLERGAVIQIEQRPMVIPAFEMLLAIGVAMSARGDRRGTGESPDPDHFRRFRR